MKSLRRPQPPPQSIYIIGAQSTGKTTLVHALEAHFRQLPSPPTVIHEVARTVLLPSLIRDRRRGSTPHGWSRDRSALDPPSLAADARPHDPGSLVVLCEAGVDWLADDGRAAADAGEAAREWRRTHEVSCQVLKEARLRYVVLPRSVGSPGEGMAFVLRSWRNYTPEK
ncbi:uncharacterized protein PG986_011223 [Apiospora aurea]|uniref:NadR/Ttd14 AAA domain-containing protein n=1 Tax=Apiospora aurea TaxID=335848 RepID=A0ABR1Q4I4_9PEZI